MAATSLRPDALAPEGELFDGGGAKRVAGREHHLEALVGGNGAKLADSRGLARTVDADNKNDKWLLRSKVERRLDGLQNLRHFLGEDAFYLTRLDFLVVAPGRHRLDDALRHGHAEVGLDQHVLQLAKGCGIQFALGEDRCNWAGDRLRGFRETVLEP